ncbi:MAG: phenylacetate--CoA ligase family protein [Planctomycetaceae bacterium]
MSFLPFFVRSIVAPAWARWERSDYLHHYRRLLKSQYDSPEKIAARQWDDLQRMLRHAVDTTPFWSRRFEHTGLTPDSISSFDEFRRIPILTKQDLRQFSSELRSSAYDPASLWRKKTSGSTGVSVEVLVEDETQQFKRGCTLRSDEWTGWRLGEPIACIWGNPGIRSDWKGKLRRKLLTRDYAYLDTLKMSEDSMSEFADAIVRTPPSLLFGHAHSLYLFATFLNAKRPDVIVRPKGIISTCMVLHDYERKAVEAKFGCPVINRYGCEEVSLIACECRKREGLHICAEAVYVEIIDEHGEPCPPGVPGRIIVTDLKNRAMPIIRYEVGDMATRSDKLCSCGRMLPLLKSIEGRVADYVVTQAGDYISGISLTENFAVKIPGVEQMQIIQEEVTRFTFNIVKGADFCDESLTTLAELVAVRFGSGINYRCEYVDRIPQEKSGKFRFCISKVEKNFG